MGSTIGPDPTQQTPSHSGKQTRVNMSRLLLAFRSGPGKFVNDHTTHPLTHTPMYLPPLRTHTCSNSNVGTHNIAIGGTLGWSKQQQYCQYSPDAEKRMQGWVSPSTSVYSPVVNRLCTSVDSLPRMFWRTWSLLP